MGEFDGPIVKKLEDLKCWVTYTYQDLCTVGVAIALLFTSLVGRIPTSVRADFAEKKADLI